MYEWLVWFLTLQLKNLLVRTIEAWVNLFDESYKEHLPILKMELIFDDETMQFYPTYSELEELILFVVEQLTGSLQSKYGYHFMLCIMWK